jgi:hypothetical protein
LHRRLPAFPVGLLGTVPVLALSLSVPPGSPGKPSVLDKLQTWTIGPQSPRVKQLATWKQGQICNATYLRGCTEVGTGGGWKQLLGGEPSWNPPWAVESYGWIKKTSVFRHNLHTIQCTHFNVYIVQWILTHQKLLYLTEYFFF